MTRSHYGAEYPHGVSANPARCSVRTLHRFDSRADRDAWVAEADSIPRSDPGYRELYRGRPPTEDGPGAIVKFRVRQSEYALLRAAAARYDAPVGVWARNAALSAAESEDEK